MTSKRLYEEAKTHEAIGICFIFINVTMLFFMWLYRNLGDGQLPYQVYPIVFTTLWANVTVFALSGAQRWKASRLKKRESRLRLL